MKQTLHLIFFSLLFFQLPAQVSQVLDATDSANTVSAATYGVRSESIANTNNFPKPDIKIYPNPTAQYISTMDGANVDQLIVYNIVGRPVKTFKANYANQYDVGQLPIGIYLVRLLDKREQTLTTIRLKVSYP